MTDKLDDKKQNRCYQAIWYARHTGKIVVPERCEVCGENPNESQTFPWHTGRNHKKLMAHHWRGYDYPLDVWWICYRCNHELEGQHDGTLRNITEAFYYVFHSYSTDNIPEMYQFVVGLRRETFLRMQKQKGYYNATRDYSSPDPTG